VFDGSATVALTLCVLLTPRPGAQALLVEYEDQVLTLLERHGGRVLQRVRSVEGTDGPFEIHLLEVPSEDALAAYMDDPARLALATLREQAIAETQVLRVEVVTP
jgi:uncharacterized protein (DUF1330 family)